MTPTEKHRETAREIAGIAFIAGPEQDDLTDAISAGLAKAEREGMKRAAAIANKHHECERDCGDVIRAAILSECGEGA